MSTFRGTIKRLAIERFGSKRLQAFRAAFPFYEQLPSEIGRAEVQLGVQAVRRRFSGAQYVPRPPLPRERYAVVCRDASGEDANALGQELRAYACPAMRRELFVYDLGNVDAAVPAPDWAGRPCQRLGIHVVDSDGTLRERFRDLGPSCTLAGGGWRTYLPYRLEHVTIEQTVDLRLPGTRAWFYETFRSGYGRFWRKHCEPSVQRFYDLLPTLMTAELGGNATTDALGRALRTMGARALIYPSARVNPESIVYRGRMVSAVGFQLVQFGDRLLPGDEEESMIFDDTEAWGGSAFWPQLRCEVAELSRDAELSRQLQGTWRLRGVREAHELYWSAGGCLGTSSERRVVDSARMVE